MAKRSGVSESLRWLEGYERLAEMAAQLPQTRLVYPAGVPGWCTWLTARPTSWP